MVKCIAKHKFYRHLYLSFFVFYESHNSYQIFTVFLHFQEEKRLAKEEEKLAKLRAKEDKKRGKIEAKALLVAT